MSKTMEKYHEAVRRYAEAFSEYQQSLRTRFALECEVKKASKLEDIACSKWGVAQKHLEKARGKYEDEISNKA